MLKNRLFPLILLLLLPGNASQSVLARCSCLDHQDEQSRRERMQAMAAHLPSESDRLIARSFSSQKLFVDAENMYKTSANEAQNEVAQARMKNDVQSDSVPAETLENLALHAADVQLEAANFLYFHGRIADAADLKSKALANELSAHKEVNLADEYDSLAKLYEAAKQPSKAAEFYNLLATQLQATKGRYSPEVADALANYRRLAKQSARTSAAL